MTCRGRFRAMPILSADVDSEVLTGMHVNEEEEAKWNIEGLVRARYESGVLARRLSSGGGSRGGVWGWAAMTTAYSKHPFPNQHEIRVPCRGALGFPRLKLYAAAQASIICYPTKEFRVVQAQPTTLDRQAFFTCSHPHQFCPSWWSSSSSSL